MGFKTGLGTQVLCIYIDRLGLLHDLELVVWFFGIASSCKYFGSFGVVGRSGFVFGDLRFEDCGGEDLGFHCSVKKCRYVNFRWAGLRIVRCVCIDLVMNLRHWTLNHQPQPLKPKPQTMDPTAETPNPRCWVCTKKE